jgi:hypothetical protein
VRWFLSSAILSEASITLIGDANLIGRVYFARLGRGVILNARDRPSPHTRLCISAFDWLGSVAAK